MHYSLLFSPVKDILSCDIYSFHYFSFHISFPFQIPFL